MLQMHVGGSSHSRSHNALARSSSSSLHLSNQQLVDLHLSANQLAEHRSARTAGDSKALAAVCVQCLLYLRPATPFAESSFDLTCSSDEHPTNVELHALFLSKQDAGSAIPVENRLCHS